MKPSILTIPIICLLLMTPLVFFQGIPSTTPEWLTREFGGVPGTVWATTAWFVAMVLLTWYVGKANTDHLGEENP